MTKRKQFNRIRRAACLLLFLSITSGMHAQERVTIGSILDSIERQHPLSRMYEADIRSMDEAARGARSWMPPELGAGLFMAPYNTQRWKPMPGGMDEGMGSLMISLQQMIPNRKKQNAESAYMQSMSAAAREQRGSALNDLYAQAKKAYNTWLVIERKSAILDENEKVLSFMVKDAEIRYRNSMDGLNAYYKAKAALGNIQNMRIMYENESRQQRISLNTLMNRDTDVPFTIDTLVRFPDYSTYTFDSTLFIANRSDLRALEREAHTNRLRMESARMDLKPQFGFRFEHMYGFGQQPQQFTLMAMVRLPMVPWASRMTKANIESYRWRDEAIRSQRQMIINEARGMATGMYAEIEAKRRQVRLYENNIIPALRNNYKVTLLAYQQNTEELFMLFDAWEALNMTQVEYLEQLQQLLNLQAELERILQIR